jgi:hypothetical protein
VWVKFGPGADERFDALVDGLAQARSDIDELKADGYLDQEELGRRLPVGMRRSGATVSRHVSAGLITPVAVICGSQLFLPEQVPTYAAALREYDDGRLTRFNSEGPDSRPFRARWLHSRHGSTAEFGRLQELTADRSREKRDREQRLVELRDRGLTNVAIAKELNMSVKWVEASVKERGLSRRRGRPKKP